MTYRVALNFEDGGTCKCKAERGEYELGFYLEDAMTEEEAAAGMVLTCQMMPRSDCVVAVPASSLACKTGAQKVAASVLGVDRLSDTSFRLRVRTAAPIGFLPGQYVNVQVPGSGATRAYSFSSHPAADEASFLIRNIPGGLMSSYLARAEAGDAMDLTGPMILFLASDDASYLTGVTIPVGGGDLG